MTTIIVTPTSTVTINCATIIIIVLSIILTIVRMCINIYICIYTYICMNTYRKQSYVFGYIPCVWALGLFGKHS